MIKDCFYSNDLHYFTICFYLRRFLNVVYLIFYGANIVRFINTRQICSKTFSVDLIILCQIPSGVPHLVELIVLAFFKLSKFYMGDIGFVTDWLINTGISQIFILFLFVTNTVPHKFWKLLSSLFLYFFLV